MAGDYSNDHKSLEFSDGMVVEPYHPDRISQDLHIEFPEHPTNIKFVFGYHVYPNDLPVSVDDQIGHPDLLLVEQVNYLPEFESMLNIISNLPEEQIESIKDVLRKQNAPWLFERQIDLISRTKPRRVAINDLPSGHEHAEAMARIIGSSEQALVGKLTGCETIEQMLDATREHLEEELPVNLAREKYMAENVYKRISELAEELNGPVNAAFLVGVRHTGLFSLLQKAIEDQSVSDRHTATYELAQEPLPLNYLDDIIQSQFASEEISDEQLARYIFQLIVPMTFEGSLASSISKHQKRIDVMAGSNYILGLSDILQVPKK